MKILFSFLFLIFSVTLSARENPFTATETFEQKKQEYLKQIEEQKQAQKEAQEAIKREKELQDLASKLEKEKAQKAELAKVAKEEEAKRKAQELKLKQEEQARQKALETAKEQNAIKYNPLNFVKFKVYESSLVIYIDGTYKLVNQDIIKRSNKFIFDFKAHADFYTKRKVLKHPLFESIAVGNHPGKGFFRVVITVKGDVKSFKEDVQIKKEQIVINKLQ